MRLATSSTTVGVPLLSINKGCWAPNSSPSPAPTNVAIATLVRRGEALAPAGGNATEDASQRALEEERASALSDNVPAGRFQLSGAGFPGIENPQRVAAVQHEHQGGPGE